MIKTKTDKNFWEFNRSLDKRTLSLNSDVQETQAWQSYFRKSPLSQTIADLENLPEPIVDLFFLTMVEEFIWQFGDSSKPKYYPSKARELRKIRSYLQKNIPVNQKSIIELIEECDNAFPKWC